MASYSAQQAGAVAPGSDMRAPQLFRRKDEGFTLVEVIWALMLIGLIAMGALALFLNSMKSVAHMQRQQVAVSLASSAMDVARSVTGGPVNAAGTSGLVKGRSQGAVQPVWDEATSADPTDTSDMTIVWDPEGGLTPADQWVPVRSTRTIASQTFTVDTLVGTCFRLRATSAVSQDCVATNPSPSTDTYVQLYRVRIVVRWDEGEAAKGAHTYRVSSLVDPSADATWNTAVDPFAYDDEFSVTAGTPASFHAIVINDSVDYDVSGSESPIIGLTAPTPNPGPVADRATVAAGAGAEINGVMFKPPADRSGLMTFKYRVKGSSGQISAEPATVSVHVLPNPVADVGAATIQVEPDSTTDITALLLANDIGVENVTPATRKTSIVPVWDRAVDLFSTEEVSAATENARLADAADLANNGIRVDSEGSVFFDSPSGNNVETTFFYYLVDDPISGGDQRFPSAEAVAVRILTQEHPLVAPDVTVVPNLDATNAANPGWATIDWRTLTGNDNPGTRIRVHSIAEPGTDNQFRLDGGATGPETGNTLEFRRVTNTAGTYVLTYSTVSPAGKESATTGTITVRVLPVAGNWNAGTLRQSGVRTLDLPNAAAQRIPNTNVAIASATTPASGTNCGGIAITYSGTQFTVNIPNLGLTGSNTRTCTFTYNLRTTNTTPVLTSANPATVTFTVAR